MEETLILSGFFLVLRVLMRFGAGLFEGRSRGGGVEISPRISPQTMRYGIFELLPIDPRDSGVRMLAIRSDHHGSSDDDANVARMAGTQKGLAKKAIDPSVESWSDGDWNVVFGRLTPGPGRPHLIKPIFRVLGEKIPKEALNHVESMLESKQLDSEGVYFAHDSLGCARYAGRGKVFERLRKHFKDHPRELLYFSFYIIADKKHEREIETVLLRIASHQLVFNERKIRASISPGNVGDYEPQTFFVERQAKKGPKPRAKS